jgi:hypothetical protein
VIFKRSLKKCDKGNDDLTRLAKDRIPVWAVINVVMDLKSEEIF